MIDHELHELLYEFGLWWIGAILFICAAGIAASHIIPRVKRAYRRYVRRRMKRSQPRRYLCVPLRGCAVIDLTMCGRLRDAAGSPRRGKR